MGQPFFRFRQFSIHQEHAAMRVSTDSVLLGAWASHPGPGRILDVGTGTAVLALMMAQRFPDAVIDAIEIEEASCLDAEFNIRHSPWSERIRLFKGDFRAWQPPTQEAYDLIICNPPYFQDSLHPSRADRRRARHQTDLNVHQLIRQCSGMLAESGRLALILPVSGKGLLEDAVLSRGLHLRSICLVRTKPDKPDTRFMAHLSREEGPVVRECLNILNETGDAYSLAHQALTKDFYLEGQG